MANSNELPQEGRFENENEVYSNVVRAGRRTYFFDVKATRNDDYFVTITESRRKHANDGTPFYDKHKIFLYKEDFEKFAGGLEDVVEYIKKHKPEFFEEGATLTDDAQDYDE